MDDVFGESQAHFHYIRQIWKKNRCIVDHYGIRDHTYEWIRQWLTTRKQRVVLDGEASSEVHVDSEVPQGTVLGPLIFFYCM